VRNVSHPLGPLHLKVIVIAKFTDVQCLIYYCTVPNLLLYSAKFTTVQCLIYYLHARNVSHPLGPLYLKAIVIV
jgi:hypothetical protein